MGAIGLVALYTASVLVVTRCQPDGAAADAAVFELPVRQQGQVLLSGLWALVGLCGLVVGLTRDRRPLRLAALGLLLVAVAKVFTFDLASLDSIYRVASTRPPRRAPAGGRVRVAADPAAGAARHA